MLLAASSPEATLGKAAFVSGFVVDCPNIKVAVGAGVPPNAGTAENDSFFANELIPDDAALLVPTALPVGKPPLPPNWNVGVAVVLSDWNNVFVPIAGAAVDGARVPLSSAGALSPKVRLGAGAACCELSLATEPNLNPPELLTIAVLPVLSLVVDVPLLVAPKVKGAGENDFFSSTLIPNAGSGTVEGVDPNENPIGPFTSSSSFFSIPDAPFPLDNPILLDDSWTVEVPSPVLPVEAPKVKPSEGVFVVLLPKLNKLGGALVLLFSALGALLESVFVMVVCDNGGPLAAAVPTPNVNFIPALVVGLGALVALVLVVGAPNVNPPLPPVFDGGCVFDVPNVTPETVLVEGTLSSVAVLTVVEDVEGAGAAAPSFDGFGASHEGH